MAKGVAGRDFLYDIVSRFLLPYKVCFEHMYMFFPEFINDDISKKNQKKTIKLLIQAASSIEVLRSSTPTNSQYNHFGIHAFTGQPVCYNRSPGIL